jgi:hypothetical protein
LNSRRRLDAVRTAGEEFRKHDPDEQQEPKGEKRQEDQRRPVAAESH